MRVEDVGIPNFIRWLQPHLVTAGELAIKLQPHVIAEGHLPEQKHSDSRFGSALTDADVLVESFIGTLIYTTWTDVSFFAEEAELDRISPYFAPDAPHLVTLDPINGTLFYKDGHPFYEIILTVCRGNEIIAAVDYVPTERKFFIAIQGSGVSTVDASSARLGEWSPFHIPPPQAPETILVRVHESIVRERVARAGFRLLTKDMYPDRHPASWLLKTQGFLSNALTGTLAGVIGADVQLIDTGAIAFIARLAGGEDNHPRYDQVTRKSERLVMAASPDLYRRLAAALGDWLTVP
ncbi:MAG: hypothetical protein HY340_02540 [Candidatus Kerfeldbacteria bacterium]|nr:hypothetical protein [Candidatus Kerfeldbacteria bacterium]